MKQFIFLLVFFAISFCAMQAQTLDWGINTRGQLGIGNFVNQPNPQTVTSVPDAVGIGGNDLHTLFLKANGTIVSAGENLSGQLGTGSTGTNQSIPVAVINLTNIIQVSGGGNYSIALRADGTVWSWGDNGLGQIGNGTITTTGCQCLPTPTQSTISDVVQIDGGTGHTLALKSDGSVWAWGHNPNGQLGDNSTTNRSAPVRVGMSVAGFTNIIAVSAGAYHSLALKSDGTVWVWGSNSNGQVGNGSTTPSSQLNPVQNTTLSNISQISGGALHSLARRTDGTVWIWGWNATGQVGNGAAGGDQLVPVQNTTLLDVVEIAANGGSHNLARLRDGSVRAWGYNGVGSLGNGSTTTTGCQCSSSPVTSSVGIDNALIDTGSSQSFALKPSFSTPTGANVIARGENVRLFFDNVTTAGTTAYSSIDPTMTGLTVPAGYTIQDNAPAYNITSTAVASGNMDVCLEVESESNQTAFSLLKILHEEGGALVDRTFSSSLVQRQICARVSSFSRFVVAQRLAPTAASVSVSGRVSTSNGSGISKARVSLTDSNGETRTTVTSSFGYYQFDEVPAGETYVLSVNHKKYIFDPNTQILNVTEAMENVNFTASE